MRARGGAEDRVRRIVSALFGVAAIVFGGIDLGAILDQVGAAPAWWTSGALVAILGTSVVLGVAAPFARVAALRPLAAAVAVGYALVAVSMPAAVDPAATAGAAPWPLGLTALGTTAAALAFPPAVAWASTVLLGISVAVDRIATAGSDLTAIALQDAAYATFFAAVFVALTLGALAAGRRVDAAAAAADRTAVDAAVERVRQEERARVDALVHDRVLATLISAARGPAALRGTMGAQAAAALDGLQHLTEDAPEAAAVDGRALADRLRNTITMTTPWAELEVVEEDPEAVLPAAAADAVLGAAGEALRNAERHAGPGAAVAVRLELGADGVVLTVIDDGAGFDAAAVPPGRLGIASSIEGRLRAAGGSALVRSRPGVGTAVRLVWPAP